MTLKKLMMICALFGLYGTAHAQGLQDELARKWNQSTGISKVYFGYTGSSIDVGLSHERRLKNMGWDVLALFSGDDDDGLEVRDEQFHLSTSLIYHVLDNSPADVYVGTGISAVLHNDTGLNNDDTEFAMGPLVKVGASYYFNTTWSLGLEYLNVFNWTNDMLFGSQEYGLLNLGYTF